MQIRQTEKNRRASIDSPFVYVALSFLFSLALAYYARISLRLVSDILQDERNKFKLTWPYWSFSRATQF